jgi:hypothetical protein
VFGVLLIIRSYKISSDIFKDSVAATFFTAGLVFIYFGRAGFITLPLFDAWAYFFGILALGYKNPFSIFLFSTLAAWVDERAVIALPIIIIFHQLRENSPAKFGIRQLMDLKLVSVAVLLAFLAYIALRLTLTSYYDMRTPFGGFSAVVMNLKTNLQMIGFGLWSFFEGFWLLYLVACAHLLQNKNNVLLATITFQILISSLLAFCVWTLPKADPIWSLYYLS